MDVQRLPLRELYGGARAALAARSRLIDALAVNPRDNRGRNGLVIDLKAIYEPT
jgi:hypothetical protein